MKADNEESIQSEARSEEVQSQIEEKRFSKGPTSSLPLKPPNMGVKKEETQATRKDNGMIKKKTCDGHDIVNETESKDNVDTPTLLPLRVPKPRCEEPQWDDIRYHAPRPCNRSINENFWTVTFTLLFYWVGRMWDDYFLGKREHHITLPGLPFFLKFRFHSNILEEAHLLQYAAKVLEGEKVKVPKVYCAFTEDECQYVLMEKVKGERLSQNWDSLSSKQLREVIEKVHRAVLCMQRNQKTEVCGLEGGAVFHTNFPNPRDYDDRCIGPYSNVADFYSLLLNRLKPKDSYKSDPQRAATFDHEFLRSSWYSQVTNFSHGDLGPKKIMVDKKGIVTITGWKCAGWWPEWVENYMSSRYNSVNGCDNYGAWQQKEMYWEDMKLIVDEIVPAKKSEQDMIRKLMSFFYDS